MKRNKRQLCFLLFFSLLLGGCASGTENRTEQETQTIISEMPDYGQLAEELDTYTLLEYQEWEREGEQLLLTSEQALEDFDYMWTMLYDSVPCLDLIDEHSEYVDYTEADVRELIEECRQTIQEHGEYDLAMYYNEVQACLAQLGGIGHINILTPNLQKQMKVVFGADEKPEQQKELYEKLYQTLANQKVEEAYAYIAKEAITQSGGTSAGQDIKKIAHRTFGDGIPYVQILSFSYDTEEEGKEMINQLQSFCQKYKDAENIIIDVRYNGGGTSTVWIEGLYNMLISEPQPMKAVKITKNGVLSQYYKGTEQWYEMDKAYIQEFQPNVSEAVCEVGEKYVAYEAEYPVSQEHVGFDGHIWILTSESCFSATDEMLKWFCNLPNVTLVGERSGGGSMSDQPITFMLPNSGLLVFCEDIAGVNEDGTINAFTGIAPDRETTADNALNMCLSDIERQQNRIRNP